MAQKPLKQHYDPQFYLRYFCDNHPERGHTWVYQKGEVPVRRSIKLTAMELDFYGFTLDDGTWENEAVEDLLQRIDSDGANAIRKILNREQLLEVERHHLCLFVSRMLRGTPAHREEVIQSARDMMPAFFEKHDEVWLMDVAVKHLGPGLAAQQWYEAHLPRLEQFRTGYVESPPDFLFPHEVTRPSAIEQVLFDMDWAFFVTRPSVPFITSDNPVAYNRSTGLGDREQGVILFPLSPDVCLQAMWRTGFRNQYVTPPAAQLRRINRYIVQNAFQEVYAPTNSSRLAAFVNKWAGTELGSGRVD